MSTLICSFDGLHDNRVLRYYADFEAHILHMDTQTEAGEKVSVHFTGLLAHWFENVVQDNILFGMDEISVDAFFEQYKDLLGGAISYGFPACCSIEELRERMDREHIRVFVIDSSLGLCGYEGLLAIAGNNRIEPVAHVQFTKEQMEHFSQLQREKAKKPVQLDGQAAEECRRILSAFFAEMTEWEQYMEQAGFEDAEAVPRLLAIWEKYVSEKPRLGYRPLGLSYSAQGTYNGEEFLDAEQITKNKLYIYTREKNTGFDRRFLMKRVGEGWRIDAVQERLDGWQRTGL